MSKIVPFQALSKKSHVLLPLLVRLQSASVHKAYLEYTTVSMHLVVSVRSCMSHVSTSKTLQISTEPECHHHMKVDEIITQYIFSVTYSVTLHQDFHFKM